MLFNSFKFIAFFLVVIILYFILPHKYRNFFLIVASYYFYMCWKPVYAVLLLFSTVITFLCGEYIEKNAGNRKRQKLYLILSLILNLGLLFMFKYYNFINETFFKLFALWGIDWKIPNMDIILTVGISFYTFQAVSYSVDVYKGKMKAEHNFGIYALYMSFFPKLAQGPIERPQNLLHQFKEKHKFDVDKVMEGLKMMLLGFFKKVVIADRLAAYVNQVYGNPEAYTGSSFILATVFFAVQIYCDFSGYSDIAIGCARTMGFNLMQNFNLPYFSTSIREFWKRWHISLSSWFGDYVYIPLGGNRVKYWRWVFNIVATFTISGLWHGASWTFVIWGALHGLYYVIIKAFNQLSTRIFGDFKFKGVSRIIPMFLIFLMVCIAWIFFRASDINTAWYILKNIFTDPFSKLFPGESQWATLISVFYILVLFFFEILQYKGKASNYFSESKIPRAVRWGWYLFMLLSISVFGAGSSSFIYFQF